MDDPYTILGVSRDAASGEIRKAYRRLAKAHHPDLHPGDKAAEERFKAMALAYGIVGNDEKRAAFDRGEIDASGAERAPQHAPGGYRHYADAEPGFKYEGRRTPSGDEAAEDIFADLFGARASRGKGRGRDVAYTLGVDFVDAMLGQQHRVTMGDGTTLDLAIPAGVRDGQTLRLRGQGQPGREGEPPGDALVEIHVQPHPLFRREGRDIHSILRLSLAEALGGAKVRVDTLTGPVDLTVPRGSNTGKVMRLRRKGVPAGAEPGDHLIAIEVILPSHPGEELIAAARAFEAEHPYDPRATPGSGRGSDKTSQGEPA